MLAEAGGESRRKRTMSKSLYVQRSKVGVDCVFQVVDPDPVVSHHLKTRFFYIFFDEIIIFGDTIGLQAAISM